MIAQHGYQDGGKQTSDAKANKSFVIDAPNIGS